MTRAWEINELEYAGPEHLDPAFVAGFDRKQGSPDPSDDIAALQAHGVGADSTVVDMGAGTGRFTLAAAEHFGRVIAVDVSPAMLDHLRRRVTAAGLPNVACVRAGFLGYEHVGPPVDAVHTRHALHQLPDFWKAVALERVARTLRPGGVLRLRDLIYDFQPREADTFLERWMDGAPRDPAAGYTRDDLAEHVRTEYSTFRWLIEPMIEAAGFEIVDIAYHGAVFGEYMCVRR